ncbi:MAG: type VI secretion system contractile sheath large subunit [Burkholderia sp.]
MRPPRVRLTYGVSTGGAVEQRELPFLIGVLANLSGDRPDGAAQPPLAQRPMIDIDRDSFDAVMAQIAPRVALTAARLADPELAALLGDDTELTLPAIAAFEPMAIVHALPSLRQRHGWRTQLRTLQARAEADDGLDATLGAWVAALARGEPAEPSVMQNVSIDPAVQTFAARWIPELVAAGAPGPFVVLDGLVARIDTQLSAALSGVMHGARFRQLEASWRGLYQLVMNTETGPLLMLRVLDATRDELHDDLAHAAGIDQGTLFKRLYAAACGTFGGIPYSLLVGDYAIGHGPDDLDFVSRMAEVAAAMHAPFIAQASAAMFGLERFDAPGQPDLAASAGGPDAPSWRAFRDTDAARYVALALPRVLMRLPYGAPGQPDTIACEGMLFDEHADAGPLWGNPAYLLAGRITHAFALYGWPAAIFGADGGGRVDGLPGAAASPPRSTEAAIDLHAAHALAGLGFVPLARMAGGGRFAFVGVPAGHAHGAATLPRLLAASRFALYVKVIVRAMIGSFMTRANLEQELDTWLAGYVLLDDTAAPAINASFPLRAAHAAVTELPGAPGAYRVTLFLQPHFQLESLTASIRLVVDLPGG